MCIAVVTTAHPQYSLIIIDNRDEFVLRPTSRPHWWTHPVSGVQVLSSRDLQRAEQGTWLAVNKVGDFSILKNYRQNSDGIKLNCGARSRGGMPIDWLSGLASNGVTEGVGRFVQDGGVQAVGGFSMMCGRLRKIAEPIGIISNRVNHIDQVPFVGKERGKTWGLSNTTYTTQEIWPKVVQGEKWMEKAVKEAASRELDESELIERLFSVLDRDTMPRLPRHATLQDHLSLLKHTIFVPPIGDEQHEAKMKESAAVGRVGWDEEQHPATKAVGDSSTFYSRGLYGTQRQTVVLVDWEGNLTYVERALWDPNGNRLERDAADVTFRFKIEGWDN